MWEKECDQKYWSHSTLPSYKQKMTVAWATIRETLARLFARRKDPPPHSDELKVVKLNGAFEVVASVLTDTGCRREINEDCGSFINPTDPSLLARKGCLAIVADGMGGHAAGEVASRIAVVVISRIYYQSDGDAQAALEEAFRAANHEIYDTAMKDRSLYGMGATCTALTLRDGEARVAHIGDSRLYLVRDGEIYLMTEDHSVVMEMVRRGQIEIAEARRHPQKNVILRALGARPEASIETWPEPLLTRPGDQFLLCSDGLSDLVEDEEIKRTVLSSAPNSACKTLIAMAKERGGHDNITVGLFSLRPSGKARKSK
ncbi:MAG: Stp1/IreP family PP2C-type Ser/Thr phosphatase [Blastocatellia bacterium]